MHEVILFIVLSSPPSLIIRGKVILIGESSTMVLYFMYLMIICNNILFVCFLAWTHPFMFGACVSIRLLAFCFI